MTINQLLVKVNGAYILFYMHSKLPKWPTQKTRPWHNAQKLPSLPQSHDKIRTPKKAKKKKAALQLVNLFKLSYSS